MTCFRIPHSAFRIRTFLRHLHQDQRGAIAVLTLLTLWCLVALIAMLWNTADYATRRQHLQNAADSMAYSSALLTARTLNQTTAQNILIAQDASADTIYRAANDTATSINGELNAEIRYLDQIAAQQKALVSRLPGLIKRIGDDDFLLQQALNLVQAEVNAGTISFATDKEKTAYQNKIRQAFAAADWVNSQYVSQLVALANEAKNAGLTDQMIDEARATIGDPQFPSTVTEFGLVDAFISQIQGAPLNTPAMMQEHEKDIYEDQKKLLDLTEVTQQTQLTTLATYYNVLASDGTAPAQLRAPLPVQSAAAVQSVQHVNEITGLTVTIDPINLNTSDAAISEGSDILQFNTLPLIQRVNFDTPGGWGHCALFPLERYLRGRVDADSTILRATYLSPLDDLRRALAITWAKELRITINVPALPNTIPDPQLDPVSGKPTTIRILPDLTPTGAQGSKTDVDFVYRRTSGNYLSAVRNLATALRDYAGLYNRFTVPYAVPTFFRHLNARRTEVAFELGWNKTFMVLSSYKLYPVPAWATPGLHDSLMRAISWEIYSSQLTTHPIDEAYTKIYPYVNQLVNEMLSRPWPYEKAPPQVPVPPTAGMDRADRQNFFSQFIVIANQPDGRHGVMFPRIFGAAPPFVAYSQAEALNWMEYNQNYGDYYTEKFDELSLNTPGSLLACPRAWRLSTTGGWNWRAKLAQADMMAQAIQNDPAVSESFSNANISNGDPTSVSTINLH